VLLQVMKTNFGPKGTIKMLVGGAGGMLIADLVLHVACMQQQVQCQDTISAFVLLRHSPSKRCIPPNYLCHLFCRYQADKGWQRAAAGDANTEPNSSHDSTHSSSTGRRNRVRSCCKCGWGSS
jgi:hypothetical protein